MKKILRIVGFFIILIVSMALVCSAVVIEKQVPITLKGASKSDVTLTFESTEGDRKESYVLTVKKGDDRSFVCNLAPNTYVIKAEDENGTALLLDEDSLIVTEDEKVKEVTLVVISEEDVVNSPLGKFFSRLSFGKTDVAAVVLLGVLLIWSFFNKKKKEHALTKEVKAYEETLDASDKGYSVSEYVPDIPAEDEERGGEQ